MRNVYVWHGIAIALAVLVCTLGTVTLPDVALGSGGTVIDDGSAGGSVSGDPDMPDGGKDPNADQEVSGIVQVGDGSSGVRTQPGVEVGSSLSRLNMYRLWMQSMAVVFRIQLGWF